MSIIGTNDQSFFDSSIFNQESGDLDWGRCTPALTYKKPKLTIDSFSTTETSLVLKNDKITAGDKLSLSTTGTDIINGVAGSIITTPASYNISSPIVFNTTSGVNSVTVLKNGNFLIAFQDTSNSNYGVFVIMSPTGVVIKSKTSFCAVPISLVDCCTLLNGNIVIAYKNATDTYMWYTIINEEGNIVKAITTRRIELINSISALALSNGMFVISGSHSTSLYGRSEFFYANGLASTSGYFSTKTTISAHSVSELLNGNIFYAFNDGASNGQFKITNKTLGTIKSETIFNTGNTPYVSSSPLQNGNVFLCYSKSTTSGCFQIISETGVVVVKTETVFNAGNTANIYSSVLQSGNILITYKNVSDGKINFVIYNQDGIIVKTSSLITTASGNIYLASSKAGIVSMLNNNTLNIIDMSELKTVDISQFNLQSAPVSAYLDKNIKLSTSFENTNQTFLDDYTPIDFLNASTSSVKINSNISNVVSVNSPIKMLIGSTYKTVKASSVTQAIVAGTGKYSNPKTIYSSDIAAIFGKGNSVILSNGNIFLIYVNSTERKVMYSIIDTFGNIIKNDVFVYGTTNYSRYANRMGLKLLSNGNILITSRSNYYSIIDTNCNVIVPLTFITQVNSEYITDSEALPGGNFVLIWYEDTGEANNIIKLSYSVYSSTGVQVKALTTFHSGTYTEFGLDLAVNKLTNGNFVIAFGICTNYTTYSGASYYAIYSATGTAVKSLASFGSGYSSNVKIALLTGGNFVVSYIRTTVDLSDYSYRVFNSAGTAVTAAIIITSQRVRDAYALPNGNFIITTSSPSATYETYSSTGVLISSTSHAANGIDTIIDIVVTPDGNIFKLGIATLKNGYKALVYSFLNHGNTYQSTIGFPVQSAIPTSIQLPSNAIVSTNYHESLSGDVITAKYAPIIKKARSLQFRIELGTGVEITSTNYSLYKVLP